MTSASTYSQGTPCWPQLVNANPDLSVIFYEKVLGWFLLLNDNGSFDAFKDNSLVAELIPSGVGAAKAFKEPSWLTYLATDDAAATASKVGEAGGTVVVEPYVFGANGAKVFAALDPVGAPVGFWQSIENQGSSLAGEAGSFIWNEYKASKLPQDLEFYEKTVGLTVAPNPHGQGYVLKSGERTVAGAAEQSEQQPPVWNTYFAVESLDDAIASVDLVGGRVTVPTFEDGGLKFAGIEDPNGAFFYLVQK